MLDSCGCLVKVLPMTIFFAVSIIGYSLTAYSYVVFEYLLNLKFETWPPKNGEQSEFACVDSVEQPV